MFHTTLAPEADNWFYTDSAFYGHKNVEILRIQGWSRSFTWSEISRSRFRSPQFHRSAALRWTCPVSSGPDWNQKNVGNDVHLPYLSSNVEPKENYKSTKQQVSQVYQLFTRIIKIVERCRVLLEANKPWLWWSCSWSCSGRQQHHQSPLESRCLHGCNVKRQKV